MIVLLNMKIPHLFLLVLWAGLIRYSPLKAQDWHPITEALFERVHINPDFYEDPLNRRTGALAVSPATGNLTLVLNGNHPVYLSKDQGESWKAMDVSTQGRAYGSFSINQDPETARQAIFMIVQKKQLPAQGLIIDKKGHEITQIGKPGSNHDGWTWGMPAWDNPQVILGKEHHAWVVLWLSKDGGQSWTRLDFESRNPGVIDSKTFVAGNDDGIYFSENQGEKWDRVADFKVTGKTPVRYGQNFYWTTEEGVIISSDQGKSWQLLGEKVPGALWGPYFGRNQSSMMVVNQEGFQVTTDHGENWEKVAAFFAPPHSAHDGKYNVMHPTNSYGWDQKRGILYAAGLGGHAYKMALDR
mgnify:CR=1 FL=1